MDKVLRPVPTCMYCHVAYYQPERKLGELTHGVCSSPLCALELILDNSRTEQQFNNNLQVMEERYGTKKGGY